MCIRDRGSTIRLSVFARRREIEIMKYVGATNHLVTLPFFVEGLTMGLISGAVSYTHLVDGQEVPVQQPGQILRNRLRRKAVGAEPAARNRCWPVLFGLEKLIGREKRMIDFEHVSKQYKHNAKPALELSLIHI